MPVTETSKSTSDDVTTDDMDWAERNYFDHGYRGPEENLGSFIVDGICAIVIVLGFAGVAIFWGISA
jgi:hypothetical protein